MDGGTRQIPFPSLLHTHSPTHGFIRTERMRGREESVYSLSLSVSQARASAITWESGSNPASRWQKASHLDQRNRFIRLSEAPLRVPQPTLLDAYTYTHTHTYSTLASPLSRAGVRCRCAGLLLGRRERTNNQDHEAAQKKNYNKTSRGSASRNDPLLHPPPSPLFMKGVG